MTKRFKYLLIILVLSIIGLIFLIFKDQLQPQKSQTTPNPIPSPTKTIQQQKDITFSFAGDAMFGRAVHAKFKNDMTEAFENLGKDFFKNDISILNLEGPISSKDFTPNTDPNYLIFKFPPQTTDTLKWLGINSVSLANNHTKNQGQQMLDHTRQVLESIEISTIGDPQNSTDLVKTFAFDQKQISIIALNILDSSPDLTQIIQEKDQSSFVIVFPHWGNEYQTTHSIQQENLAHTWIDAGADLIIGSHPHVIQDAEIYNEKPIFYSLGNFLFDQTFSQNTQRGLIIQGTISKNKLKIKIIPIASKLLKPELLEEDEKFKIINQLREDLGLEQDNNEIIELNIN